MSGSAEGGRVLVVEDEPRLRDMLVRAVREMEFVAAGVGSAESALVALAGEPSEAATDVLLVDLNLPGAGGLELCRAVRERWPGRQFVILTGYGDLEAAQAAIRLDATDFLTKPVPLGDLERALARAMRRRANHVLPRLLRAIEEDPAAGAAATGADERGDRAESAAIPPTLAELERRHIEAALARCDGNREEAAAQLGISVRTLYYRLRDYARREEEPR